MKSFLTKLLNFLCLLDNSRQQLSITNIILWIVAVKIAATHNVGLPELGSLLLALLNYSHKRYVSAATAKHAVENQLAGEKLIGSQIDLANQQIKELANSIQTVSDKQKESAATISEATTLLRANRLSSGMNRGIQ